MAEHQSGTIKGYTSERLPVELVWSQDFPTRDEAKEAEARIKKWSRTKKEALIDGDWDALTALPFRRPSDRRISADPAPDCARSHPSTSLRIGGGWELGDQRWARNQPKSLDFTRLSRHMRAFAIGPAPR